ncbi:MAG: hypothetical protein JO134_00295 [Xanthobacteraceae bacterium]|nr:hypothetical protein [Xanthobacteraceae bacterium]
MKTASKYLLVPFASRDIWRQGGFSFGNIAANAGLGASQTSSAPGSAAPAAPAKKAPDWTGIAITVIGLIVALMGLFKD